MRSPDRLFFGLLAASLSLLAQPTEAKDSGILFYYSGGGNFIDTAPLNTSLDSGFKDLNGAFWGQGVGAYGIYERVLFGGEYQSLWGQTTLAETESLHLSAQYTLFHLGYILAGSPQFQVYPYLGLGWGNMQLSSSQDLGELLNMSLGSSPHLGQVSSHNWLLDLGLGLNATLPLSQGAEDSRGPSLGLRAGYLLPLGTADWYSQHLPVQGGSNLHPGGFYLRLMLGFGAYQP